MTQLSWRSLMFGFWIQEARTSVQRQRHEQQPVDDVKLLVHHAKKPHLCGRFSKQLTPLQLQYAALLDFCSTTLSYTRVHSEC